MSLKQNISFQSLLAILQGVNLAALPGKIQLYAGIACQIIAMLAAARASKFNSDGTPQTEAFKPKGSDEYNTGELKP